MEIKHRDTGSTLFEAEVGTTKLCLEAAVKSGAYLRGADLGSAYLGGAYLKGADLRGAYLRGADLGSAYLGSADLKGADLGGAYLGSADLGGADLKGADLRGADLGSAYLGGAKGVIRLGPAVDGYEFFAVQHETCVMIKAGCRWFSLKDAAAHWKNDARPEIGDQRRRWMKFIKAEAKALGWTV